MSYTADQMKKLTLFEAMRARPGMYIGGKNLRAVHHLVSEVVANSVDEIMNGHASDIHIKIEKDGTMVIEDNGRGIPTGWKSEEGASALSLSFTVPHFGGKFESDDDEPTAYNASGGLHGIGLKAVNAFSEFVEVTSKRRGMVFKLRFEHGGDITGNVNIHTPDGKQVAVLSESTKFKDKDGIITHINGKKVASESDMPTGTTIRFRPKKEWFDENIEWSDVVPWEISRISALCRQVVHLNPKVPINLSWWEDDEMHNQRFYSENGLVDYLEWMTDGLDLLHPTPITFSGTSDDGQSVRLEVVMHYTTDGDTNIISFVNGIRTPEGGTHVTGFQTALTMSLNRQLPKNAKNISGQDYLLGLSAIIKVTMTETPQFSGQAKEALTTQGIQGTVQTISYEQLKEVFSSSKMKRTVKSIIKQAEASAKGREYTKKARSLIPSGSLISGNELISALPIKLADVSGKADKSETVLYIVEGDSAGGTCKQARDRDRQAILSTRGKPLNAMKSKVPRVLNNGEIQATISAIGAGVLTDFNVANRRYGKIAIFTDADDDGRHIRALWYAFFWRFMRPLITEGHLYVAVAPLYRVYKDSKEVFVYDDAERDAALKKLGNGAQAQRYKGLGEMSAEQLRATTFSPNGKLQQVIIEDEDEVVQAFGRMMGSSSEPRKKAILEYIKKGNENR